MSMSAALDHVGVGPAVDERHHPLAAQALGQAAGHDVVLVVIGHRQEEIHLADVFLLQQFLVGGVAEQDEAVVQLVGD